MSKVDEAILTIDMVNLDDFTLSYIEAALWSSHDDRSDEGAPLDKDFHIGDLADETRLAMAIDCARFQAVCGELFVMANMKRCPANCSVSEAAGHDFWLTRNGHGAGFWDGDWSEPAATTLDENAKAFGNYSLYVGDDGKIYGMKG